jgi:NAD(P)-dependent dehydrogenase (short-subunit alcohol dehydrogenase family)
MTVAVVTGGARGLGRAITGHLAAAGHALVIGCRTSTEAADELVKELEDRGTDAVAVPGDVSDAGHADELVAAARHLGELTVWVNNAGISVLAPLVDTDPRDLERMLAVNVSGTFHGMTAAARSMVAAGTPGRIINVASELGVQAFPYLGAYSATKFAVVGLTQAAALELGEHGITVNAVCPGTAETDMVLAERASEVAITGRTSDQVRWGYLDGIPAGRFCDPDDVGALVAFVASPAAAYLTGQALCVNGGSVLH